MKFDSVLINGDDNELYSYSYNSDCSVVVDWRGDDDLIVNDFGKTLEGEELSAEYTETGLLVNYNEMSYDVALPFSMKNRYVVIRAVEIILSDKYKVRVFEDSLKSDTHVFYVKPKVWWEYMDSNFSERMKEVFIEIEDDLDFDSGRPKFYATGVRE